MQENENVIETEEKDDIVKVINDVKAESERNRALYEKSEREKAELAKALLNNDYSNEENAKPVRTSKEIAEEFFVAAHNDQRRRGFELALEYREARKREANKDPFVKNNPLEPPSSADYIDADVIAEGLQSMIEDTEDETGFNLEYNRLVNSMKK